MHPSAPDTDSSASTTYSGITSVETLPVSGDPELEYLAALPDAKRPTTGITGPRIVRKPATTTAVLRELDTNFDGLTSSIRKGVIIVLCLLFAVAAALTIRNR